MAVEGKRGCGYRKVGGLYMVGGGIGVPCDRLPFALTVCSCYGQGIKQALGWTWVDVAKFFQGPHLIETRSDAADSLCDCGVKIGKKLIPCPLCHEPHTMGRAGLLWIGEKFYKSPDHFISEGVTMGFSRRVKAVPQGFKIGETWVLLAHSKTVSCSDCGGSGLHHREVIGKPAEKCPVCKGCGRMPGVFYVWKPQRLERIYKESDRQSEEAVADVKRGITPVFVPDNDKDHQGNVHDDYDNEHKSKRRKK